MKKVILGATVAVVVAFSCVLLMGRLGRAAKLEAAIVPGADLLLRVDAKRAGDTPIAAVFEQFGKDQAAASGMTKQQETFKQKMEQATGLGEKDLVGVLASADIDPLNLMGSDEGPDIEKLVAVLAVQIARPMTMDQLKAGLKVLTTDPTTAVLADVVLVDESVGGCSVLKISPAATGPFVYVALSQDGKVVFIAPNVVSMEGVLQRSGRGKIESLASDLAATEKAMPGAPQTRLAFLLPESVRTKMKETMDAETDPMAAMTSMYLKPFAALKSLSLGMEFSDMLSLAVVGSFSAPEDAAQVSGLVSMVLPMLSGGKASNPTANMIKKLNVKLDGKTLTVSIVLTADEIKAQLSKVSPVIPSPVPVVP
jgi:hypothetical protein